MDDIKLTRISLDNGSFGQKEAEKEKNVVNVDAKVTQAGSILIPKITSSVVQRSRALRRGSGLWLKILLIVLVVFILLLVVIAVPFYGAYQKGKVLYTSGQKLSASFKAQDIPQMKSNLKETSDSLAGFKSAFAKVAWTKALPFVGGYVSDIEHGVNAAGYGLESVNIGLSVAEPYMDLLGFSKSDKTGDGAKTAQERINFFVKAIPDLTPKMGEISQKVNLAKAEIDAIDIDKYPVTFQGKPLREPLKKGIELFDNAASVVGQAKPILEAAPYFLGLDSTRTYMLLFQNDKELRPTGGFMTAYAIMKVDKAKFTPVSSSDIYNLDSTYKPTIKAPAPVIKYLKGPYALSPNLRLRDMNWSPDFGVSMKEFTTEAEKVGIGNIDGVIAVDTQLLVNILDVIGPIGVPGFGNFSTKIEPKCNCPQVIYELESFADVEGPVVWDPAGTGKIIYAPKNYDNRKKIIGPLMNSILANVLGQPKDKLPGLFEAAFNSLFEKHVLVYTFDDKAQKAAESFGIAGKISDYAGDYLHINDANLGGRKSNLYTTQEVVQDISVARDGSVEKTVTITYKNSEKQDGWLNSVLPDWVRIYVPKGSKLIEVTGLEDKAEPYEELGKTVFAGYFTVRPLGVSKVTLKYKLPFKVSVEYKLLIQKQPGTATPLYTVNLGKKQDEFTLKTDKEIRLGI